MARGRRPAGEDTRAQILDAARAAFAEHGYDRSTIRLIAGSAGVDPALVHHYFGTKEDLFSSAMELPFRPADVIPAAIGDDATDAGRRLARLFFSAWESPATRDALLAQLRHAMASGDSPAIAGFISQVLLDRIADRLDGGDRRLRAELAASHLIGVAMIRYVVRLEPVASAGVDELVEWVGPRIQTYLTP